MTSFKLRPRATELDYAGLSETGGNVGVFRLRKDINDMGRLLRS